MLDFSEINPHLGLWQSENYESPFEKRWMRWSDQVEKLLGHDLDGDEASDGYSIDGAFANFEAGETAENYVAEVRANKKALAQ